MEVIPVLGVSTSSATAAFSSSATAPTLSLRSMCGLVRIFLSTGCGNPGLCGSRLAIGGRDEKAAGRVEKCQVYIWDIQTQSLAIHLLTCCRLSVRGTADDGTTHFQQLT